MATTFHNPDQYMASLRQIAAQGRKRLGFLVGAGAPVGLPDVSGSPPLIPAVAQLTAQVLSTLAPKYGATLDAIKAEFANANIEDILSRTRSLAAVIGSTPVHHLNGAGHKLLSDAICAEIGAIVNRDLPPGQNAYTELIAWIGGVNRTHPIEIFTTNYDLLFEQALERAKLAYFDGFSGAAEPFFDPSSVATNDLPSRWTRVWKLHGSLGWGTNAKGEVVRLGGGSATHLVFPEHLKYDQTQKAPYSALFDRLKDFLSAPDTLLIATGFSFADTHIAARVEECLAANPSASVFAFQYRSLADEQKACAIASRRANMSVYGPDMAMVNGIAAKWQPGDLPTRDWGPIRQTYWDGKAFTLGDFASLMRFFAGSRASHMDTTAVSVPT